MPVLVSGGMGSLCVSTGALSLASSDGFLSGGPGLRVCATPGEKYDVSSEGEGSGDTAISLAWIYVVIQ